MKSVTNTGNQKASLPLTRVCQNWWGIQLQLVMLHRNSTQARQLAQSRGTLVATIKDTAKNER